MTPILVVIDFVAKTLTRYAGRQCTHVLGIEGDITAEKVALAREFPDALQEVA